MGIHLQALKRISLQRNELRSKLDTLDAAERYHRGEIGENGNGDHPARKPRGRRSTGMTQAEAAKIVLSETDQPLNSGAIAEAMVNRKLVKGDLKIIKRSVYQAMASKSETFKNTGGKWSLR